MPPLMLLVAFALLVGTVGSGIALVRMQSREEALRRRVDGLVNSQFRDRKPVDQVNLVQQKRGSPLLNAMTGFFGFNLDRADQYAVQWWLALAIAAGAAVPGVWIVEGVIGDVGIVAWPLLFWLLCRMFFAWSDGRRKEKLFRQFPDALAMIVRSVRVGIPVTESIRAVAREVSEPTGPEFAHLGDDVSIGVPLDQALRQMAERNDLSEYRFFATALTLQAQTGGGLSETLENLAEVIRKRVALKERGNALASEAKTSSLVLGLLPIVAGFGLWLLNRAYLNVLFDDPMGHVVLGIAAGMLATGMFVMRTIIKKSLS